MAAEWPKLCQFQSTFLLKTFIFGGRASRCPAGVREYGGGVAQTVSILIDVLIENLYFRSLGRQVLSWGPELMITGWPKLCF